MKKYLKDYLKLVKNNIKALNASDKSFKSIYEIMFSNPTAIAAETSDGFRIHEHTYGEVKAMIRRSSESLYARIGATHGYVALDMDNCLEWIVAFWAILRSGNKPYLVNRRHPLHMSAGLLETLNIKYVIGMKSTSLPGEFIDITALPEGSDFEDCFEDEIALSTSATTLNQVVCFYTGNEISEQVLNAGPMFEENMNIAVHVNGRLKQICFLPFYHVFGLIAVYFWHAFYWNTMVFPRDMSGETLMKTCRAHQVTHVFAVPLLWHTIEKQVMREINNKDEKTRKRFEKGVDICLKVQNISPAFGNWLSRKLMTEVTDKLFGPTVRYCISGGSYIKESTLRLFSAIGYPLHNGYGMSEVGITSTELRNKPSELMQNSVGKPFASIEYNIDENGVLLVKGNSTCKRMLVNGVEKFNEGWYNTGDIVDRVDGYYYVRGRKGDSVIGENGENLNPDTIEQAFELPEAIMYSVLGLGEGSDEKLTMIVRISPYLSGAKVSNLISNIYKTNQSLPLPMQIRDFYMTYDPIASETAIKVGRKYLKNALADGRVKLIPFNEVEIKEAAEFDVNSPLADKVRTIAAPILGVEKEDIGPDTHVMHELGASSLQYFTLLTELSKEFPIDYSDSNNYFYTLRDFCEYIERQI